jgi:uncharacterized protein (DUF169 family)
MNKKDFAILNKFEFDTSVVAVKFTVRLPEGIGRLSEKMTLCEMLRWAQRRNTFYADVSSHTCDAGLYVLGQKEVSEQYINGEYGAGLGVYDSPRSGSRLYQHISKINKGLVNYVSFAPLDTLEFDPDLIIVTANTTQAEIILRASSYKTGRMWSSKYTAALGCSWILIYPYLSGEINYITTGLGFGMRRRHIFPEGLYLISIPFDVLPSLLQTLREMPWEPEPYKPDGLEYVKNLRIRLGLDKAETKK